MTTGQATTQSTPVLLLRDAAGDYYVVPREALEQGRLTAEDNAAIERWLAGSDDVAGHAPVHIGVAMGALYINVGAQLVADGAQAGNPIEGLYTVASGLTLVAEGMVIGLAGLGRPPIRL